MLDFEILARFYSQQTAKLTEMLIIKKIYFNDN